MEKTIFKIQKMDCPSEEQMVRMKLHSCEQIEKLEFDIPKRELKVYHNGQNDQILSELERLNLDITLISTEETEEFLEIKPHGKERKLLWTVLTINVSFFAIEIITGFVANSIGLVADSLDMLADGIVYGLALFAVGGTVARKKNIAKFAGYFQIVLALIGFTEVVRRFIGIEKMPDFQTMIIVSIFALIANVICLYLLQKGKSTEAHMQQV
jgi:Co/Zn/Cd efflux system component